MQQRTAGDQHRIPVKVRVDYDVDGRVTPLKLRTANGHAAVIEQVTDVRPAQAMKAGGMGMRYTCRIGEREFYLFQMHDAWFVER